MTLPDLALQIMYGKVAWALVLAALLLACVPALARRHWRIAATAIVVLAALPGEWSPAYWLALAFQYPSGLLVGLSLVSLQARPQGRSLQLLLPLAIALPLAMVGAILYLDTFGVLALGLYYGGFGAAGAPLLGCAGIAACALAIHRGHAPQLPLALATSLLLYALLRLPTGNLWDALLDPLLWMWALGSAVVAGVRQASAALGGARQPAPVPVPVPVLAVEPTPVGVAAIEQLQTVRE